uniref:Uncharacterized protein n=1 Tax=Candidatus Kentrum sp. LPFa TaxID=2126335 RepID=A0A450WXN1_9GAMM|nr:MAG: hypothetical protein BECKLPF1236B_GA0070989_12751 [Candidatus Kentron sp. LPFa]
MNRRQALFQYHFTLESRAPYSIIWYWKRLPPHGYHVSFHCFLVARATSTRREAEEAAMKGRGMIWTYRKNKNFGDQ